MADRLAGGNLKAVILAARAQGTSLNALSRQLFAEFGVEVSAQTLANWINVLSRTAR